MQVVSFDTGSFVPRNIAAKFSEEGKIMETTTPQPNIEDYSAASTTIKFDRSIPLLRRPIPAGPHDDPSSGAFLLAFGSPQSWASAYKSCESKILSQCEHGARVGCAVSASNKCKPAWWRNLMRQKPVDFKEREDCEVREMEVCLAVAKEKCVGFAKEKLVKPFREARIAGRVGPKDVEKLVFLASWPEKSRWRDLIGVDCLGSRLLAEREFGVTNYRASELLGSDNVTNAS